MSESYILYNGEKIPIKILDILEKGVPDAFEFVCPQLIDVVKTKPHIDTQPHS